MSFMEIVAWILVYLGQTLLALAVLALWALLGFLVIDEIRALRNPEPVRRDDNNQDGGLE